MLSFRLVVGVMIVAFSVCLPASSQAGPHPAFVLNRAAALQQPPAYSFDYEISHIRAQPNDALKPVERPLYFNGVFQTPSETQVTEAEAKDLSPEQMSEVAQIREKSFLLDVGDLGQDLPRAARLYAIGALAFHHYQYQEAIAQFDAVLKLPAAESASRAVWARYMIGRSFARLDDASEAAIKAFEQTRDLVLKGLPDPLGLGVASFGEEARVHLDRAGHDHTPQDFAADIKAAISLYLEQAIRGSYYGMVSLRRTAREAMKASPDWVAAAIEDPTVLRVIVTYVLTEQTEGEASCYPICRSSDAETLLAVIEDRGITPGVDGARLAVLAYTTGRYDLAAKFLEPAKGPLATWVKAKLAFRSGEMSEARALFEAASKGPPGPDGLPAVSARQQSRIQGELALLRLANGEYVSAMEAIAPALDRYWFDGAYIAERILTTDELKTFVDIHFPSEAAAAPGGGNIGPADGSPEDTLETGRLAWRSLALRYLLARRLMRDGRFSDAIAYFPPPRTSARIGMPDVRQKAIDYTQYLQAGKSTSARIDRARSLFAASKIARYDGLEIMGTEGVPDGFGCCGDLYKPEGGLVTPGEVSRWRASRAEPVEGFHYRYLARDEALQAADLLPPKSQAFAAVLCHASHWMLSTHDPSAELIYARYIQEGAEVPWATHFGHSCPEPDFDSASQPRSSNTFHWIVMHFHTPIRRIEAAVALGILAVGLVLGSRRRAKYRRNRP